MRTLILIVLLAVAAAAVSAKSIHQHNDVRRFLGLPSISDIKEKLTGTLGNFKDKILDALLEVRGDIATAAIEAFLRLRPYIDKLKIIFDEIRSVTETTESDWAKERERLLEHIKDIFDMVLAEEEVQALMQKVQEMIDSARETAKSSKEKALDILKKLGDLVLGEIVSTKSSKRSIDSYGMDDHMVVKRFLGLPSISDITGRIKEKLTETLDKVQNKILETILAGGDIAIGVLETVLQGQKTLLPYADKLRIMFDDIASVAEATDNAWAEQREGLLAHIKEMFDMILAEEEVVALMQKVEEMIDSARETAKSSKEKAQEILKNLRVLVWGVIMSAESTADLIFGKRDLEYYDINDQMMMKRFLGLPSISDIYDNIKDRIIARILAGGDIAYDLLERILQNEKIKPYAEKLRAILYEIKEVVSASEHEWGKLRERLLQDVKDLFDMFMSEEKVQAVVAKVAEAIDKARDAAESSADSAKAIIDKVKTYIWAGVLAVGAPIDLVVGGVAGKIFETIMGTPEGITSA
ncbi:uncharacterized protein LOC135501073 [Lineus longissimus]|uniref:uncharacterized protein LOC135501073 n=1 Tax=Lineus longissimus TaxID=88925 RepID=UPI002B4DBBFC